MKSRLIGAIRNTRKTSLVIIAMQAALDAGKKVLLAKNCGMYEISQSDNVVKVRKINYESN